MRAIDADALKNYIDAQEGRPFIGCTVGQALKIMTDEQPTIQPDIVRCKDCKYWNNGSCEYPEHAVNSQDYWVGDIETEAEHFCGYAERREVME